MPLGEDNQILVTWKRISAVDLTLRISYWGSKYTVRFKMLKKIVNKKFKDVGDSRSLKNSMRVGGIISHPYLG